MSTKTITVEFNGGFHGYNNATVRAKVIDNGSYIGAYISAGQARKLANVFCGMHGCVCGGVYRADMDVPAGWTKTTEGTQDGGLVAYKDKA